MTIDEMANRCWRDLPRIRRRLAGKEQVRRCLIAALREFDAGQLEKCRSEDDVDDYKRRLFAQVAQHNTLGDNDGFAILIFLVATVVASVISWLVQRWLDNRFNHRSEIEELKAALT